MWGAQGAKGGQRGQRGQWIVQRARGAWGRVTVSNRQTRRLNNVDNVSRIFHLSALCMHVCRPTHAV